jgi:hypothetical protein
MGSKFFFELVQGFPLVTPGFMLLPLSGAPERLSGLGLDGLRGCPCNKLRPTRRIVDIPPPQMQLKTAIGLRQECG